MEENGWGGKNRGEICEYVGRECIRENEDMRLRRNIIWIRRGKMNRKVSIR